MTELPLPQLRASPLSAAQRVLQLAITTNESTDCENRSSHSMLSDRGAAKGRRRVKSMMNNFTHASTTAT